MLLALRPDSSRAAPPQALGLDMLVPFISWRACQAKHCQMHAARASSDLNLPGYLLRQLQHGSEPNKVPTKPAATKLIGFQTAWTSKQAETLSQGLRRATGLQQPVEGAVMHKKGQAGYLLSPLGYRCNGPPRSTKGHPHIAVIGGPPGAPGVLLALHHAHCGQAEEGLSPVGVPAWPGNIETPDLLFHTSQVKPESSLQRLPSLSGGPCAKHAMIACYTSLP